MFWRRLSIRARITIGSLLVAIAVAGIAAFAVRANVEAIFESSNLSLASTDLASFEKDLAANPNEPVDQPSAGMLVYIRSADGRVAVDTMPHDIHEILEHRAGGQETFSTLAGRVPYVVVGETISTASGRWSLWSARSTASSDLALDGLDRSLFIGSLLVLIAFGLASWLLATFALRPVGAMRKRADGLGGLDAGELLPVGPADDEIAALAKTLNAFLERVRRSTEREKQMVSDAAHELRTPLAALRTQLELAHDSFGDARALALEIEGAEASIARLSSLAASLLELSRIEGDSVSTGVSSTQDLVSEAMGSVDRARMLALSKEVDVGYEMGELDEFARYALDADAFSRLLDNLLSNAVTAVDRGGHVTLTLRQVDESVEVTVSDDGPGIPAAFLPFAFDRFSRPDESRSAGTGGSGLGLALVQAIAHSANGTAQVTNGERGLIALVLIPKM
ncbi:MAG: two-component system, OmpR family, sensor kinase [Actinomycetota bacterium]|jgi:signal transduction histidine kinase|nr:two-component system, OmpR family, sensor kinase [Actinomycetota bacterium]